METEGPQLFGLEVAALIVGTVQLIKNFFINAEKPLSTNATTALALIVGMLYILPMVLVNDGYLTDEALRVLSSVIRGIGYVLAIPGLFSVAKDEVISRFSK